MGTVAFLEPEHQNSYFHMTERGMSKIIEEGNLSLEFIEPVQGWNVGTSMKILPLPGMRFLQSYSFGISIFPSLFTNKYSHSYFDRKS